MLTDLNWIDFALSGALGLALTFLFFPDALRLGRKRNRRRGK